MYGAILGDMIGSPYEFDQGNKSKEFPLFTGESHFTDDTVMTIAVAEALMKTAGDPDDGVVRGSTGGSIAVLGQEIPGCRIWSTIYRLAAAGASSALWKLRQWFGDACLCSGMAGGNFAGD